MTKCIEEETPVIEEKLNVCLDVATNSQPSTSSPQKMSTKKRKDYKSIEDCEILCDVDLVTQNYKAQRCKCPPEIACGDTSCWNRATSYECPSKCAHGTRCKNRRFQNVNFSVLFYFSCFSESTARWNASRLITRAAVYVHWSQFRSLSFYINIYIAFYLEILLSLSIWDKL